jgi:hypothetical protein
MKYADYTEEEKNERANAALCWLVVYGFMLVMWYFQDEMPRIMAPLIRSEEFYTGEYNQHVGDPGFVPTEYTYIPSKNN